MLSLLSSIGSTAWPWDKPPPPEPEPDPTGMPTSFIVCIVMWFVHGFVLDILVIGVLPFISVAAADAQRADKFPWALGGYTGFEKVKNLEPTHRRFIAENAAYAVLRIGPAFFITCLPVMCLCVFSYLIEAITIAWVRHSRTFLFRRSLSACSPLMWVHAGGHLLQGPLQLPFAVDADGTLRLRRYVHRDHKY